MKRVPHTCVIVFAIIVVSAVLTWIIPGGEFERTRIDVNGTEREVIVKESFRQVERQPQTWQVFSALYEGFQNTAPIIAFILLIGGAFWIMNESRAIDQAIRSFLRFSTRLERFGIISKIGMPNMVIVMVMIIFSVFGAVFGMSEETIAFVVIFIPLAISMGYDSIVGVGMVFVAAALGFAGAVLNPFTVGIAQGLSDLPLYSGMGYRMFCWVIITITGIAYVLVYAIRIRRNPERSPVWEDDRHWREVHGIETDQDRIKAGRPAWVIFLLLAAAMILNTIREPMTTLTAGNSSLRLPILPVMTALFILSGFLSLRRSARSLVLVILIFTILYLVVGVMGYGWYIMEIATLFFAMGIFAGVAMGYSPNRITRLFIEGAKDILSAAMVVGLAGGIIVILEQGMIIDTILHGVSLALADLGKMASVSMMYLFQTLLNVIIPSGSGKAALTMPLMSQFSDLIGVSRQATVMAFQFGDGFTNMITPTSGVLIGVLGVARIPYHKWVKWVTPLIFILIMLGLLLLIPTVTLPLKGF